jgi:hypothetical protein
MEATLRVRLATPAHAELARAALAVDAELSPERSSKALAAEGAELVARFDATDARNLRVAVSAFCDMLCVVLRTLREFGGE